MKICKVLKKLIFLLMLGAIFTITACHTNTGNKFIESDEESSSNITASGEEQDTSGKEQDTSGKEQDANEKPHEVTSTGDFSYNFSSVVQAMAVTEKGYYYIANDIMYFYYIENDISIPMCSRTECTHSSKSCDASAYKQQSGGKSNKYICDGRELFFYNNKLYMVECTEDMEVYLCEYDSSFNDKVRIALLSSYEEETVKTARGGAYTIHDGYFYYYTYVYNSALFWKGNYMIELNCMKVQLTKGATPEKVGNFEFAGDHTSVVDASSMTVLTDGENIYYVAGDFDRAFESENPMEYIIAKYSASTKEFAILDSYLGVRDIDAWGENIGYIECIDNNVCMAGDGTMYAITDDGIAAINFETNTRKKIYTSPYNTEMSESVYQELKYLTYDGTYLYFVETEPSVSTYLTAIDTEGNLIRRYEFEFTDAYRIMQENRESRPTVTGELPQKARISGEINLLGVANGNILVASRAHVYKDLTGRSGKGEISLNDFGIGMISLSDFLENKEIKIKQIYQY